MTAALELRDVGVRFGAFDAVDGVSLTVHAGEVVGLIGPNGAGKTVTFNVVTGLQPPTRGQVLLGGVDVTRAPAHTRTAMVLARLEVDRRVAVAALGDARAHPAQHVELIPVFEEGAPLLAAHLPARLTF